MTCDGFYVKNISFMDRGRWRLRFTEGDCEAQIEVYDDAVQEAVEDNFPYISETVCKKIEERVECAWDNSEITDEERTMFLTILKKVMP